ncbi:hypothetical protein C1646_776772 [Rhizophagus diaphanus]|nr:hypothetical protein C1646_776772 [Rhizophagus diaphanus] [Rhizophagus sp. MUCL 43196]
MNGDIQKTFTCHLIKHCESSTRQKENIPNEKCQITKTRPSGICSAMIRVIWIASSNIVQPKAIRALVELEAGKNYSPPAIISAIKEYAMSKLDLGECARELKRKEVLNIKYKVRGPTESDLLGNLDLKLDISESVSYLTEQGYLVKTYHVSQWSTKGIVFALEF